jgi:hypothetical protein
MIYARSQPLVSDGYDNVKNLRKGRLNPPSYLFPNLFHQSIIKGPGNPEARQLLVIHLAPLPGSPRGRQRDIIYVHGEDVCNVVARNIKLYTWVTR